MRRNLLKKILILLVMASLSLIAGCDTEPDKEPYVVINVNYSGTVDATNKLYVIFYAMTNRTVPFLTFSSSSKQIIIPRLNIGDTAIYFDIIHDINGDGVGSGDLFQGWSEKTVFADLLTPMVLPSTDMIVLNVDLDNNGVIP